MTCRAALLDGWARPHCHARLPPPLAEAPRFTTVTDRDIRQTQTAWVRRAVVALDAFNNRHPWSHNDHFHGWVLRNLPRERRSALDVGCGHGELAWALSDRFEQVRAIDTDVDMVRQASVRLQGVDQAHAAQSSFLAETGCHDLITMVAVLHHLDLTSALVHARQLLKPGGRLLVVGLARLESRRDLAWDIPSSLLNPIVGLLKHPRVAARSTGPPYPVTDPVLSFDEIKSSVETLLPGARLRHGLFFRHTLLWEKPLR